MDLKELPGRDFMRHPWEIARAAFFLRLLREHVDASGLRALDIGAGDGYFAGRLGAEFPAVAAVTCFDPGYDNAWLNGQAPRGQRLDFTASRPAGTFDLVLLLDVLEHVADDQGLLREATASAAMPGGWMLLSAPAHQALFSRHDELLGHQRRYSPDRLRAMAAESGLDVVAHGQLFTSLLLPRAAGRLGEAVGAARTSAPATPALGQVETSLGTWQHGAMVTSLVTKALALDAAGCRFAARWRIPLPGLSAWVLARRR